MKVQLRPQRAMLKECFAPVTAHESGAELFLLKSEMGRDKRENVQRNAVDGNKGVPPLADIRQHCGNVLVKLRDVVKGEAVGDSANCIVRQEGRSCLQHTMKNTQCASAPRSKQRQAVKGTDPSRGKSAQPWWEGIAGVEKKKKASLTALEIMLPRHD